MHRKTLALFALPIDPSERLAKLKACKRAKIVKVEGWIIALSHVSAYQASAAKALVDLGAHMSAVAGKKNDKIEMSLRCTRQFTSWQAFIWGKILLHRWASSWGGWRRTRNGCRSKRQGRNRSSLKQCLVLVSKK